MILSHNFSDLLETLCRGDDLTETEAGALFEAVFAGEVDAVRLGAILAALKAKGESSAEIRGAAKAMLAAAAAFPRPADLEIGEIVGTGGDGARTINISTTAALAAAGAGLFIAKHGNRAVSSLSGASDVLTALGVEVAVTPEQAAQTLVETGFTFCFAPVYHSAMKFAAPVRRELGVRTIFNLLGPLTNPARPDYALIGVYDPALLMTTAETLKGLGVKRAFVVYGRFWGDARLSGGRSCGRHSGSERPDHGSLVGWGRYPGSARLRRREPGVAHSFGKEGGDASRSRGQCTTDARKRCGVEGAGSFAGEVG